MTNIFSGDDPLSFITGRNIFRVFADLEKTQDDAWREYVAKVKQEFSNWVQELHAIYPQDHFEPLRETAKKKGHDRMLHALRSEPSETELDIANLALHHLRGDQQASLVHRPDHTVDLRVARPHTHARSSTIDPETRRSTSSTSLALVGHGHGSGIYISDSDEDDDLQSSPESESGSVFPDHVTKEEVKLNGEFALGWPYKQGKIFVLRCRICPEKYLSYMLDADLFWAMENNDQIVPRTKLAEHANPRCPPNLAATIHAIPQAPPTTTRKPSRFLASLRPSPRPVDRAARESIVAARSSAAGEEPFSLKPVVVQLPSPQTPNAPSSVHVAPVRFSSDHAPPTNNPRDLGESKHDYANRQLNSSNIFVAKRTPRSTYQAESAR
ncbi:Uu.00g139920.m01.CDS01 [Anthostomella pinea]|uniref:Uu.00g139920.m01.CDS01 n=1 Tax=Anthostomella pinea TaxID=933095 RepID=A0AAI8VPY4_9PEZI|nr:Uu.00g139920.m01.CDS01 [Anthostomella pinea]